MLYGSNNPHGGDIYCDPISLDHSVNINPFGPPPSVLKAITCAAGQLHHYPDPHCRELVQAISRCEGVPPNQILCGNGAAELIYAYCQTLRPACALVLAPTFSEYARALQQVGCRILEHSLSRDHLFDPDEALLSKIEEERPQAVFLCNPNNPTGRLFPQKLFLPLLSLCRARHIHLFVDECFLDLSDDGVSAKSFLSRYPMLFLLKALTKSYALAGVRLGYCLCADSALLASMSCLTQPWNVSVLAQAAGVAALEDADYLKKARSYLPAARQWLRIQLESFGFWVCPSSANYLLFHGPEGLAHRLRQQGIAIRDCQNYTGLCPGWYRISVGLPAQNAQLTAAIAAVMRKELPWQKTL